MAEKSALCWKVTAEMPGILGQGRSQLFLEVFQGRPEAERAKIR
ncbi:hypothetical protein M062_04915 [Pseudomonas aeruginosa RP73]|nr:hypothetical protein [Pseudomonas aeruginosa]AGO43113.1 hypothetical protein M062_04915 [Pseudomonas aeruginosa RP73]BAR69942.1 hypothetical protein PA8380_51350 [Pseudomonas aeruginosa]GAA16410.1 hypothetical protein NCGM1179_1232 [Pseudomonas aeruginosa NCMG1179]SMZ53283.1 hypothetical protein PANN_54490 [Pseudomonas aeruginosa C-NN2]